MHVANNNKAMFPVGLALVFTGKKAAEIIENSSAVIKEKRAAEVGENSSAVLPIMHESVRPFEKKIS